MSMYFINPDEGNSMEPLACAVAALAVLEARITLNARELAAVRADMERIKTILAGVKP